MLFRIVLELFFGMRRAWRRTVSCVRSGHKAFMLKAQPPFTAWARDPCSSQTAVRGAPARPSQPLRRLNVLVESAQRSAWWSVLRAVPRRSNGG